MIVNILIGLVVVVFGSVAYIMLIIYLGLHLRNLIEVKLLGNEPIQVTRWSKK